MSRCRLRFLSTFSRLIFLSLCWKAYGWLDRVLYRSPLSSVAVSPRTHCMIVFIFFARLARSWTREKRDTGGKRKEKKTLFSNLHVAIWMCANICMCRLAMASEYQISPVLSCYLLFTLHRDYFFLFFTLSLSLLFLCCLLLCSSSFATKCVRLMCIDGTILHSGSADAMMLLFPAAFHSMQNWSVSVVWDKWEAHFFFCCCCRAKKMNLWFLTTSNSCWHKTKMFLTATSSMFHRFSVCNCIVWMRRFWFCTFLMSNPSPTRALYSSYLYNKYKYMVIVSRICSILNK